MSNNKSRVDNKNKPREKMIYSDVSSLSDQELLMAVLGSGSQDNHVEDIANSVYESIHGNLYELEGKRPEELFVSSRFNEKIDGIGPAKGCLLIAAVELGKRVAEGKRRDNVIDINSPEEVKEIFQSQMRSLNHEEFHILLLNLKRQQIGYEKVSSGGIKSACAEPTKVFLQPIKRGCRAIIIAHNHPSGDPNPSKEDISSTKILSAAGKILGIEVLDHIIIAGDKWYSFVMNGLMEG
ncbi:MAG: DNA repair protein RadC [Bacillota bacterium]|nr:DNA repair protein RadC [Bacillota bacterium]